MGIKEKILYYIQKGTPKTEAIKELKKEYKKSETELYRLWTEIKEATYTEEQRRKKRGTGRQVKATSEDILLCRAIRTFGADNQKRLAQEELAELIQAISKDFRGLDHNVEEEIADVEIMLEQLRKIYDRNKINQWKEKKLKRLKVKIEGVSKC